MRPDRIVRSHFRSRLLVTLKEGATFDGVLVDADANSLELRDAAAVSPESRTKVDGSLFLPRADVAYMQHVS